MRSAPVLPQVTSTRKTLLLQLKLDPSLVRHLKVEAAKRGLRGVRGLIEEAVLQYIGPPPNDQPKAAA